MRKRYRADPALYAARKREARRDPERRRRENAQNMARRDKERLANAPAHRRRLVKDRAREKPPPARMFMRCPADQAFDTWMCWMMTNPVRRRPDLDNEPEVWRDFVVPDYLSQVLYMIHKLCKLTGEQGDQNH